LVLILIYIVLYATISFVTHDYRHGGISNPKDGSSQLCLPLPIPSSS